VLLVDNHVLLRRGLRQALETETDIVVVGEAADGLTAAELAQRLSPDVVIIDLLLASCDAFEACRRIRELKPSPRIIVLTDGDSEAERGAALRIGADGYLPTHPARERIVEGVRLSMQGVNPLSASFTTQLVREFRQVRSGHPSEPPPCASTLSARENEVLSLVATGMTNKEIGAQLFISENTVKNHVRNMLVKLELHSRLEAALYAIREHLADISW